MFSAKILETSAPDVSHGYLSRSKVYRKTNGTYLPYANGSLGTEWQRQNYCYVRHFPIKWKSRFCVVLFYFNCDLGSGIFFLFKIDLLCGSTCKSNGYLIALLRMSYVNVNQVKKSSICRTIVVTFFTLKFLDVSYLKYFISILIYRFNWYGHIVYIFILKWNMNMFSHL